MLKRLAAVGLVVRFPGPDGTTRFGVPNPEALDHFECNGCHRIIELSRRVGPPNGLAHLPRQLQRQRTAASKPALAMPGTCRRCRVAGSAGPRVERARAGR